MKYFVVSEVHSFYTPLKTVLDNAGFDPERHYKNGFNNCDIFPEDEIIGLDDCTVINGKANCQVIED